VAFVEPGEDVLNQKREVLASLAKRRHLQHDPAQAIVEVFPKHAALDCRDEIPMGRGDDPHVHVPRLGGSHRPDLAILQKARSPTTTRRRP
jgi:hypothetical protein